MRVNESLYLRSCVNYSRYMTHCGCLDNCSSIHRLAYNLGGVRGRRRGFHIDSDTILYLLIDVIKFARYCSGNFFGRSNDLWFNILAALKIEQGRIEVLF